MSARRAEDPGFRALVASCTACELAAVARSHCAVTNKSDKEN